MKKLLFLFVTLISFNSSAIIIETVQGKATILNELNSGNAEVRDWARVFSTTSLPTMVVMDDAQDYFDSLSDEEVETLMEVAIEDEQDDIVEILADVLAERE